MTDAPDPYAEEKALAKRVAVNLRATLAKLEDAPRATPCHDWPLRDQLPTTEPDA